MCEDTATLHWILVKTGISRAADKNVLVLNVMLRRDERYKMIGGEGRRGNREELNRFISFYV
jgi:hypothetical protein